MLCAVMVIYCLGHLSRPNLRDDGYDRSKGKGGTPHARGNYDDSIYGEAGKYIRGDNDFRPRYSVAMVLKDKWWIRSGRLWGGNDNDRLNCGNSNDRLYGEQG